MPVSHRDNKPVIERLLREEYHGYPMSVLDIGIGWGNVGSIVRSISGTITLIGIEIFPEYINDNNNQKNIYNAIIIGDAAVEIDRIPYVDIVLMIDVFEHFEKDVALTLLQKCISKCSKIIMCIPITEFMQGPEFGNIYEEHKYQWSPDEIVALGGQHEWDNGIVGIFTFSGAHQRKIA